MLRAIAQTDVVHHLYQRGPALDLIPYCGAIPGRDAPTGDWNIPTEDWDIGHDRDELLQCANFGLPACMVCASCNALGGFTPLILGADGGEGQLLCRTRQIT